VELEHRFTVPAPVEVAWEAFNDLERIAPCFPGAALSSYDGDAFAGLVKVKLGPISLQYNGTGRFVERDPDRHRAVIEAKGKDRRGNGTAAASITAELTARGDATDVQVRTDLAVTGRPAQFGRGVMQDVSDTLLGRFATCLEQTLASVSAPAAAADEPMTPAESVAAIDSIDEGRHRAPEPEVTTADEPMAPDPVQVEPVVALDVGATVLPVLLRRYAPYLLVVAVVAIVLKGVRRRRR
jgi:carbon monoxide dehydrogenase subunit G